jgi:hypothetical protein
VSRDKFRVPEGAREELPFLCDLDQKHDQDSRHGGNDQDSEHFPQVVLQFRELYQVEDVKADQQRSEDNRNHSDQQQKLFHFEPSRLCLR